jgi:electron transfer flavoprotein alpha subunit
MRWFNGWFAQAWSDNRLRVEKTMTSIAGSEIWVFGDLRNERFFGFGLNVLAKARQLAKTISGKAAVVLLGTPAGQQVTDIPVYAACKSLTHAERDCLSHGADIVYVIEHPNLAVPRADSYATVIAEAVRAKKPKLMLFALTDFGRELASRVARLVDAGLIADCLDLRSEEGGIVASCPSWGGQIIADIGFADNDRTGFATVQPHICKPETAEGEPGIVERLNGQSLRTDKGLKLLSCELEAGSQRQLEKAEIVVVGGAGLGNMDGFALVRELAAAIGGEVGATRPPVLNRWADESRMIGQTGKTVRPGILLSVGTSGAVQYTAAITESKTIVAVNRDQNSPIFQIADIGIVADAKTFLPVLTTKVKQVVMRKMADVLCDDGGSGGREGFGEKVCKLRESYQWSREALAEATGQTPEFIDQIEKEELEPSVSFLLRLAKALKVDPGTFLRKEEKEIIRGQREQSFIKRTRNYSYQALTPGAEQSHLRAFMVTIESKQTHKPVEYKHEGEEFIYVMEGEIEVTLGGKTHHLKTDESIHFNSEIPHKLKSLSNEDTRCLVVLYTV